MEYKDGQKGGIGFFGLLTILFIGLKLGNVIDWSWWWVLSPLWVPITALVVIAGLMFIGFMVHEEIERKDQ